MVAGELGGSCCNCYYGSEGARCSLRAGKFINPFLLIYRWFTGGLIILRVIRSRRCPAGPPAAAAATGRRSARVRPASKFNINT